MTYAAAATPLHVGLLASASLIAIYLGTLILISGWAATIREFSAYWYYVLPLAAGFGWQVSLYARLRQLLRRSRAAGTVVATSGTTSAAAMLSCCAHYLVNVAPVLGAAGLVTLAAQYQAQLFWVGIAFNLAGIAYIGSRLRMARKEHSSCLHA